MIVPVAFFIGFAFGWLRARRRGGNRADCAQYGAAHGILFLLVAVISGAIIGQLTGG